MGKSQEVEGCRLLSLCYSISDGKPAKFNHFGFGWFHFQIELAQSFTLFFAKPFRILSILETGYVIIGITNQSGKTGAALAEYLLKPEVKGIVKVDIGQQRRNDATLSKVMRYQK